MANAFTPGPWTIATTRRRGYPYRIDAPNGLRGPGGITSVTRGAAISMPSSAEGQANARLIAAAPCLLKAALPFDLSDWFSRGVLADTRADEVRVRLLTAGTAYEHEVTAGQLRALAAAIARATGSDQ